jgi:Ca2+-binding EF-hand superfamily protein
MPRKQPEQSTVKKGIELRAEIKDYIRNERDTVLMKWRCLEENVATVDKQTEQFNARMKRMNSKRIPVNIQKFINTLKRKVRKTIKEKGGTPFSIVRALFLYWGTSGSASNATGTLTTDQLSKCMQSLGVTMTTNELEEVVAYYSANSFGKKTGSNEMSYDELLADISAAEPTIIEFSGPKYFEAEETEAVRFKEREDDFAVMPPLVKQFVEVSQNWIMTQMRAEGGTPHQHVRDLFHQFDYSQSSGLRPNELVLAATKKMKVKLDLDQAEQIVKFYDRKREGFMPYEHYLNDVTKGTKPILSFNEITAEERKKAIKSLTDNPLVRRPFHPKPNRVLEEIKVKLKATIAGLIDAQGGALGSWLSMAFSSYDRAFTHVISDWKDVQGAFRKVNLNVTQEDALCVMRSYDVHGDGRFNYVLFIKHLEAEETHFLKPEEKVKGNTGLLSSSASARTPADIAKTIQRFKSAVSAFVRKSGNILSGPDLLHGTFLSNDGKRSGRAPPFVVGNVSAALGVNLTEAEVNDLVDWFDTNATRTLDYNSFTRHLYGQNALTEAPVLPRLNKYAGKADYKEEFRYVQGEKYSKDMIFADPPPASEKTSSPSKSGGGGGGASASSSADEAASKKAERGKALVNSIFAANGTEFNMGAEHTTPPKLNPVIESPADKKKRLDSKRQQVLNERRLIAMKLAEVDQARKQLQDNHTKRKNDAHSAAMAIEHAKKYQDRVAKRRGGM